MTRPLATDTPGYVPWKADSLPMHIRRARELLAEPPGTGSPAERAARLHAVLEMLTEAAADAAGIEL